MPTPVTPWQTEPSKEIRKDEARKEGSSGSPSCLIRIDFPAAEGCHPRPRPTRPVQNILGVFESTGIPPGGSVRGVLFADMKQEAEVQTHRIERAQLEISDLRQEITAVTKALDNQLSVLDALRKGFLSQRAGWSYLSNGDMKHEVSVIGECISHVENRIKSFKEMRIRADELESWVYIYFPNINGF